VTHRSLHQLNPRVLLKERGRQLGRPATLDDLQDTLLDDIADQGFDWVWLLGVWQTEAAAGSPFAITAYDTRRDFGGDAALARLRERLARRGLRLLLDFVPNHTALDHPWVATHPEYYVRGDDEDLAQQPQNYLRLESGGGRPLILAHGRDPNFDGWPDTLQLNLRHGGLREAQLGELHRIADRCDGVRCDMAMLVQPEVFRRTWGDHGIPADGSPPKDDPFWREAIPSVRRRYPQFLFVAEVYWDMEWELQQAGFDYTTDRRLHDRLRARDARAVNGHLHAEPPFQERLLRFLENPDEPRVPVVFPPPIEQSAAVISFLVPGMALFRRPDGAVDEELRGFYARLLPCLRHPEVRDGAWQLGLCRPAWADNPTHEQFVVSWWHNGESRLISAVNYGGWRGQCYVTLSLPGLAGGRFVLADLLSDARHERSGDELCGWGLYLDMPPWGRHVFDLRRVGV
jgi:hypothetical protein